MEEKTQDKYKESIGGEPEALKESSKPASLRGNEGAEAIPKQEVLEPEKEIAAEKKPEAKPVKEKKIEEVLEDEKAGRPPRPPSDKVKDKIEELKSLDQENQVKTLTDLAFQEGPDFAVEVAKGLDSPYVLDELHKKLTEDESYKKLLEEEKLKKL